MKWLTLEQIKSHCRVDFDDEDKILESYGNAAENGLLRVMNRSWEDVVENLSEDDINGSLTIAGLLLVEHLYVHRGPTENIQPHDIPYGVEFYVKPYMRLTTNDNNNKSQEYGKCKNL